MRWNNNEETYIKRCQRINWEKLRNETKPASSNLQNKTMHKILKAKTFTYFVRWAKKGYFSSHKMLHCTKQRRKLHKAIPLWYMDAHKDSNIYISHHKYVLSKEKRKKKLIIIINNMPKTRNKKYINKWEKYSALPTHRKNVEDWFLPACGSIYKEWVDPTATS